MSGVLEGFAVIGAVIALGYLLGRAGVLEAGTDIVLSRLVFYVATPALLFRTLTRADLATVLTSGLVVTAAGVAVSAGTYIVVSRAVWHRPSGPVAVGALASSYVNAGYLGIPIAVYVLGDASWVAPVMLFQLVVMAPVAFAVLDGRAGPSSPTGLRRAAGILRTAVRNPVTLATLVGVTVALSGVPVPGPVSRPVDLVAGLAVPGALIAYGLSLRGAARPGAGGSVRDLALVAALKLLVQPLAAYTVGRFALGLHDAALLAVTITAALPTAQNVFVYAVRYDVGVAQARDAIAVTTVLSAPVIIGIAALLG